MFAASQPRWAVESRGRAGVPIVGEREIHGQRRDFGRGLASTVPQTLCHLALSRTRPLLWKLYRGCSGDLSCLRPSKLVRVSPRPDEKAAVSQANISPTSTRVSENPEISRIQLLSLGSMNVRNRVPSKSVAAVNIPAISIDCRLERMSILHKVRHLMDSDFTQQRDELESLPRM